MQRYAKSYVKVLHPPPPIRQRKEYGANGLFRKKRKNPKFKKKSKRKENKNSVFKNRKRKIFEKRKNKFGQVKSIYAVIKLRQD